jgi:very-short-patch-repair endonuclease
MRDDLTLPGVTARFKSDRAVSTARSQRKAMTPAEKALWFELRQRKLEGSHFRRQAVIGPFVVDFAAHGPQLIIELDGGVYSAPDIALRDDERTQWLEGRGYKVLRLQTRVCWRTRRLLLMKLRFKRGPACALSR